jgi:hypothetical protein
MPKKLFQKGVAQNPAGRPRDSRNRLTKQTFEDILAHWNEIPGAHEGENPEGWHKGKIALNDMWRERPHEYVKAVLSVLPKELQVEALSSDLSDHDIDELTMVLQKHLEKVRSKPLDADEDPVVH